MKSNKSKLSINSDSGFTIVEIIVITLIIGVLLTILLLTYSGIQVRQRNTARITDIKLIQANLETFYAQSGFYPTLAELNDSSWTTSNLKQVEPTQLHDPSAKSNTPRFSDTPKPDEFSYQPTSSSGTPCDDKTVACGKYVLTATLEGNAGTFVEDSLNQ